MAIPTAPTSALVLLAIAALFFTSGCASQTLIDSQPAGAAVIVDGDRYVGETPVRVRDLPRVGERRAYQISKEGYYPRAVELVGRRHRNHVIACACSVGLLWPVILFNQYPSSAVVTLQRQSPPQSASFDESPRINFGH